VLKRNLDAFAASAWLATLTAHIPNAGTHLVRYYGWYSNVSPRKRWKVQGRESTTIEKREAVLPGESFRQPSDRVRDSVPGWEGLPALPGT
jgi:hypothetical protein